MCDICKRQELERAYKALRLNGDFTPIYNPRLLAASVKKHTLHIKKLKFTHSPYNIKLRTASFMQCPDESRRIQKQNAEKALRLNVGF